MEAYCGKNLWVGLMSGTSLDGVDAVLMNVAGDEAVIVVAGFTAMPADLRQRSSALYLRGETSLKEPGEIDHLPGWLYARAVNELLAARKIRHSEVRAVGCYGQTAGRGSAIFDRNLSHHGLVGSGLHLSGGDAHLVTIFSAYRPG